MSEFSPEAPYGYMTDPVTGERRPKKSPGRQRTGSSTPKAPSRKSPPKVVESKNALRRKALSDFLTIPTAGLAMAGEVTKSKPLLADAIVLGEFVTIRFNGRLAP